MEVSERENMPLPIV